VDETTEETPLHRLLSVASHGGAPPGALAILIEALLAKHADLLAKDSAGATPLHVAAFHGETVAVSTLCYAALRGASTYQILNAPDAESLTPLGLALRAWQVPSARILAVSGAEAPNITRALHCSPDLISAVLRSSLIDLDAAKARAAVDCFVAPNPGRNSTLLHLAALLVEEGPQEAVATVQELLDAGAKVATADSSGETPLMSAVRTDDVEVVLLMLEAADRESNVLVIDAVNRQGQTALHVAASAGSSKCLRVLVTEGAATDVKDIYGQTPIDIAEQRGEAEAVRFLRQGASVAAAKDNEEQGATMFKSSGHWTAADELAADMEDAAGLGTDIVAVGIVTGGASCVCLAFCILLIRRRCRRRTSVSPEKPEAKKARTAAVSTRSARPQPVWVKPEDADQVQKLVSGRISPRPGSDSDVSEVQGGRGKRGPSVVVHAGPRTPKQNTGGGLNIPTAFSETGASTRASTAESGRPAEPRPKKAAKAKAGLRAAAKGESPAATPGAARPRGKAKAKAKRG